MKKKILFFITIAAILTLGACSNESLIDEGDKQDTGRTISISALMPDNNNDDPTTRLDLNLKEDNGIKLSWEVGDELELLFVKGPTKIKKVHTILAEDLLEVGKRVVFDFTIPEEITGAFDLYCVFGGGGIDNSNLTTVILPTNTGDATSLESIKSRKDVTLTSKAVWKTEGYYEIKFKHLGSIFSINLTNTGTQPWDVTNAKLVGVGTPNNWAYNVGAGANSYDFITGSFSNTGSAGNFLSFKIDPASINAGETKTLYVWSPLLPGVTLPDLKLEVTAASSAIYTSANTKSKVIAGAPVIGKNYAFDANWDGTELNFATLYIRKVTRIARVTGTSMSGETFPNPNNTAVKWNVGGTDLGVIWEMDPGKYGIFFGDTFGSDFAPNNSNPGPNGGSWRSNVLAYSNDSNLDDGLSFSGMATGGSGDAREIIYSQKNMSGNGDLTSIPSAAIRANGIDYVHYFNIKTWTGWVTNYSGMYKSIDNGITWTKSTEISFSSNSYFGQVGYFKKDGYVYMIGTQTGRNSNARLARFIESDIENQGNYEYWNSSSNQWIKGDENSATNIIEDKVGELSFIYNQKHKKWIIAYFNETRYNITMRTADNITGPWSRPYELAAGSDYAQLYGSYFHPISVNGDDLYFLMSMWLPYNVFLMKVELGNL